MVNEFLKEDGGVLKVTLSMLRLLYTVCYSDWGGRKKITKKCTRIEKHKDRGPRELNGQTVSEPGQFCRNVRDRVELLGRGGRRGDDREG